MPPLRTLVIGGRGYYGARVVEVLRRLDGLEIEIGGRHGPDVSIDLARPETFDAMGRFDLVVNCADSVGAPSTGAAAWCLRHGNTFFDMGADRQSAERLLALREPDPRGVVVVGVGIFPGLSTALAAAVAREHSPCQSVVLGIRLSPFSGAGPANCAMMTDMLAAKSLWFEDGQPHRGGALGPAMPIPFMDGSHDARRVALPDAALIHHATGTPNVATHFVTAPALLMLNFAVLAWLISAAGPLRPALLTLTRASLVLLRAILLRSVSTGVELTVVANGRHARTLHAADGQLATAVGVGAVVALWRDRAHSPAAPGVYTLPELFDFASLHEAAERLTGGHALFTLRDHP